MKRDFTKMTIVGIGKTVLGWFGLFVGCGVVLCGVVYGILAMTERNYSYEIFESKAELSYYAYRSKLVEAVDGYIGSVAKNSAMNGVAFIDGCDEYGVDLIFVLSQCQLESVFCTRGIAVKTLSAFNVMAYDGRSAKSMKKKGHCYKHPDLSIKPYLKLLRNDYLVDGRTECDLLDNYVNKDGKRYASNGNYERDLREIYRKIRNETNILDLYEKYEKYKIISGR